MIGRKRQMKRMGIILVTGVILCTATACGKRDVDIQIVEGLNSEPEYINFFASSDMSNADLGKIWSDRFTSLYNENIYVNYDRAFYYADEGLSYRELLEKRLESSSPDDLYIINAEDVLEFEKKGYWMDLSKFDFVDNLSDAALYQSIYNGKVFSVPLAFTGFGFYWNVTMLKEHGLSVPNNKDEFMKVCEKLKSEGILPYGGNMGYSLTVPAMCIGLSKLYGTPDQEQRIDELNSGETAISSYMAEGFEFLAEMIDNGYMDPKQAISAKPSNEDVQLFKDEGCAFICAEMGLSLNELEKDGFELEFTGLPLLEDGCIAVYGADSRLCVNPQTEKMDTVIRFIEMVGSQEALDESAMLRGVMSSAKDSELEVKPLHENMFELLKRTDQIPNQDFSLYFNTWENIRDRGREICNGASVDEACETLDALQVKELKEYIEKK